MNTNFTRFSAFLIMLLCMTIAGYGYIYARYASGISDTMNGVFIFLIFTAMTSLSFMLLTSSYFDKEGNNNE